MNTDSFNQQLLDFLTNAPTPFHAVKLMSERFDAAGFQQINEEDRWSLSPGRYYVTRNQSSIVAFVLGSEPLEDTGIRLVGAHTDSPCLKVKPRPEKKVQGYLQLGVEVYGGVLLNPWFDRDLSIAGRITHRDAGGNLRNTLIDLKDPVAVIPSLAIHLDREVNNGRSINAETFLPPILLQESGDFSFNDYLSDITDVQNILATDLCLYDTNPPALVGARKEFLASARLDNLLSCFSGMMALLEADDRQTSLLVCNDHEEVGSASAAGADGTFLLDVLDRMIEAGGSRHHDSRYMAFSRSLMISTDNAHGVHPNFAAKHEENHGPKLNQGPVIKYNANQRYATNSETAAYFKALCQSIDIDVQELVNRADLACGSTIGPITAKATGIRTLDVGAPTFAMHSIRELAGTKDAHALMLALIAFYQDTRVPGVS